MKKLLTKGQIALIVIFSVLIIDQIIKIWIKTHMYWHESIRITNWFYIYFTENNVWHLVWRSSENYSLLLSALLP